MSNHFPVIQIVSFFFGVLFICCATHQTILFPFRYHLGTTRCHSEIAHNQMCEVARCRVNLCLGVLNSFASFSDQTGQITHKLAAITESI